MKALLKKTPAPGAAYEATADLRVRPDEILIKVHRASICGSDLPIYGWNSWAPERFKTPSTFGHEFCGAVTEIGAGARDFAKGDFVSVESHIFCGLCYQCRNGQRHVCREMKIIGVDGPGGFGEYAAVPARCAWKHKDDALKDLGSLFEPFGNAVYSVLVEPVATKSVLVMGCGPQGLFSIAVAKASGASPIVAVEGSAYRADLARRMGAAAVVEPGNLDAVLKAGKAEDGYDVVCEMSGAQSAIAMAFKAVRSGGRISAFGLPSKKIEIDWANDLIFKGVRVHGIVGREIFETWYKADRLLRCGAVDLAPVVTHTFPLKDYEAGFAAMSSPDKKCGKVLFVP
ncbi:MAG TPA: L-threonine 3-dehydrogenase [Elusimicrobia bacterium]|nr:MAG: L-threonine 3-dehydrogenase [Elusimicrobia bacterium GWA2_66_18]OGR76243.1 MAG: L-threonine 3-dehydrogenase [Elusimicrobia bacterium GWC2_65_9]HAZ08620.1 L-threonine 3-dehydrogenase [Elusimicrobiota bacterium]